ncbi:hypothetical protein ACFO0M_02490 [Micromonospora mangrovi]|uniref:Nucleoside phosphorylase domain-containing protein n=2 Tax=Micromonospora TaxID=1873 RepID=A0AAU7M0F6_9ACTN
MPELSRAPSWAQCRTAARSVWSTEYAREAIDLVRPRGPLGIIRSRGPLPLMLYVAARDGRLVWNGPESLAILQPPGDIALPAVGGLRLGVLRRLARAWDITLFAVPPALMLVGAALAALWHVTTAGTGSRAAVLLLAVGAVAYLSVLLTCLVVTGLGWFYREFGRPTPPDERIAAELMPGQRWTLVFCHHVDDRRPRLLLELARQQLADLLRSDVEEYGRDVGTEIPLLNVTETLVCLQQGVTTQSMRDVVDAWTEQDRIFGANAGVTVKMAGYPAARPPNRLVDRGGFLFWYLAGEAVVVTVAARLVADQERAACAAPCTTHPVDYGRALHWLGSRLFFTDPYGLTPATHQAWTLGLLTSLMSLMGVFVTITAAQQYLRVRRTLQQRIERKIAMANRRTRTLIIVATDEENQAVCEAAREVTGCQPELDFLPHQTVQRLGTISRTELMLVQVRPGSVGPGSAAISAAALVSQLEPHFLILTGICYGLRPDRHEFGDILVCDQLRAIDHRKEAEPAGHRPGTPFGSGAEAAAALAETPAPAGSRTVLIRGDAVTPSTTLLSRFRAVAQTWTSGGRVHFGPMLSASTLVSARSLRDELHEQQPEALGGEMEGAGVYAAAAHAKVDWILVKAICDWGFEKGDDFHERAARNAARFVVRVAEERGFDLAPPRGSI